MDQESGVTTGVYRPLFNYLRDRFADRVVLTFGEIEDLIGLKLPESARLKLEWWGNTDTTGEPSTQAGAWTLASRTAAANLVSRRVVFDRV